MFVKRDHTLTLKERIARGAIIFDQDDGMTDPSHRDDCDINSILKRYELSGLSPLDTAGVPTYGDFTAANDYHAALNAVKEADAAFMTLPARIRDEFNHDPAELIAALEDPSQVERLVNAGILVRQDSSKGVTEKSQPDVKGEPTGEGKA